jgi:hydroxymethylglutaryl-CoA reductase
MSAKFISGFSKLKKDEKLKIISENLLDPDGFIAELESLNHNQTEKQNLLEQFSENTLGNFPLPYGVAPNFLINRKHYIIPMVTEESSVVAAASSAARFWSDKGGFHAKVKGCLKTGQIHFCWHGDKKVLLDSKNDLIKFLLKNGLHLTQRMIERGGGVKGIELIDFSDRMENYFQLQIGFQTADSMGANFINSVLEDMSSLLKSYYNESSASDANKFPVEIIMSILSNYTPDCIVECYVETGFASFNDISDDLSGEEFTRKFKKAVDIASLDTFRAVTHNKGIFNGVDAVVLATANDFRAVEAAGHAYASRNGKYSSLSKVEISGGIFRMSLELPVSVGTVGGLTSLHPLAKWSFEILNKPDSAELMMIIASVGLASNFAAIRSLITKGIQEGHMKMHLGNILSALGASDKQRISANEYFKDHKVSYHEVEKFIKKHKSPK